MEQIKQVRDNRDITRLELEDLLMAAEHHSVLPDVKSLVLNDDRAWEIRFIDSFPTDDFSRWQTAYQQLLRGWSKYSKCVPLRFQAKVKIPKGSTKSHAIALLENILQDQHAQGLAYDIALPATDSIENLFDQDYVLKERLVVTVDCGWPTSVPTTRDDRSAPTWRTELQATVQRLKGIPLVARVDETTRAAIRESILHFGRRVNRREAILDSALCDIQIGKATHTTRRSHPLPSSNPSSLHRRRMALYKARERASRSSLLQSHTISLVASSDQQDARVARRSTLIPKGVENEETSTKDAGVLQEDQRASVPRRLHKSWSADWDHVLTALADPISPVVPSYSDQQLQKEKEEAPVDVKEENEDNKESPTIHSRILVLSRSDLPLVNRPEAIIETSTAKPSTSSSRSTNEKDADEPNNGCVLGSTENGSSSRTHHSVDSKHKHQSKEEELEIPDYYDWAKATYRYDWSKRNYICGVVPSAA